MNKRKALYHIIFWAAVYFYDLTTYIEDIEETASITSSLDLAFIDLLFYIGIAYINLYILIPKLLKKFGKLAYITGVISITILTLTLTIISPIYDSIDTSDNSDYQIFIELFFFTADHFLFILISFLYWYFTQHKVEKERALQLQNEKLQAQLRFLKSQISPHFLFNSLNNIYSLVIQKNDNAAVMIEKISNILRYIIYEGKKKKVTMEKEIELVENYIELQFLKKLKNQESIEYTIKGDFLNKEIAPLLIINIIENCFKHSNLEANQKGFLQIHIFEENNKLTIHTQNTYTPKPNKRKGVGLQNLKQQLKYHYPATHLLNITDKNGIFNFELSLELN